MRSDYTYPSVYFAYTFFALMFGLAAYYLAKNYHGYFGKNSEEPKYRMLEED